MNNNNGWIPPITRANKQRSKFSNGMNNYKWYCIDKMIKMKVGDSIVVKDRGKYIIQTTWLWRATQLTKYEFEFKVRSIDNKTQEIYRVS